MNKKIAELDAAAFRFREDIDTLRIALEEIRDLARTGCAPDAFNMTPEQWNQHKIDKIAYLASKAIRKVNGDG